VRLLIVILLAKGGSGLLCYCQGSCPDGRKNGTCEAALDAGCFASAEEVYDSDTDTLVAERTYGCLPPAEAGLMMCRGGLSHHATPTAIECCRKGDLCNQRLYPMYDLAKYDQSEEDKKGGHGFELDPAVFHLVLLCTVTVCIVSLVFLVTCIYIKYKGKELHRKRYIYRAAQQGEAGSFGGPGGTLAELMEQTSGSGAGLPLLVQRTIAKQVQMKRRIGQGRYGEVWLASWRGEKVAVKTFFTTEEASWFRETEIYQTVLMRHNNILGFIAADIKGSGGWTQMLLVTDYYERGSLYDYLQITVLDVEAMTRLTHSIACGVSHLHTEISGSRGKPAIAHRDIKSRNILVRNDGTAVIADFGLAVRYRDENNSLDISPNTRVGTRRYMAPEILDNTLKLDSFESFKAADIYCLGLVFWEVCRRTHSNEKKLVEDPAPPFHSWVPADPSHQDMYQVVCLKGVRPEHPERWSSCGILSQLGRLMCEMYHKNPAVRPTALRVKKSLSRLVPGSPIPGNPIRTLV